MYIVTKSQSLHGTVKNSCFLQQRVFYFPSRRFARKGKRFLKEPKKRQPGFQPLNFVNGFHTQVFVALQPVLVGVILSE
ncbi:MAG: hypothetical protein JW833_15300 [Prolixibacteraceae bacterium]|nr:hypothetical protein [Prolixibacteraceae bacterium]